MDPVRLVGAVRRSLFGPVNHEQLRRELSQRLRDITEQDSRRWNFDFQRDAPLPGRFQWEEVPKDRAASFYGQEGREGPLKEKRLRPSEEEEEEERSDQENCPRVCNVQKRPEEVTPVRRKRARSKSAAGAPQNTRITDFFVKRRRSVDTKSVLGPVPSQNTDSVRIIR